MVAGEANNQYPQFNGQHPRITPGHTRRVLILSRNNRCRSQMLDAWIRHIAGQRLDIVSAGIMPDDLHPLAVEVMFEVGMDISSQTPTDIQSVCHENYEFIVTLDDYSRDHCPTIPGARWMVHHPFRDPDMVNGSDDRRLGAFRMSRDDIHDWAKTFVTWATQQPLEPQAVSA